MTIKCLKYSFMGGSVPERRHHFWFFLFIASEVHTSALPLNQRRIVSCYIIIFYFCVVQLLYVTIYTWIDNGSFSCHWSSAITWYKDGRPVTSAAGVTLLKRGQVLEIERAQLSDAGMYRCVAVNLAGVAELSQSLQVLGDFFFKIILYTHQVVVLLKQNVWRNTDVSWIMIDLLIPSPTDHFQSRWDGHSGGEWSCQTGVRGHWCSSTQPHLAQRRQPCGECVTWHSGTVWSTWIQFGSCFMIWL